MRGSPARRVPARVDAQDRLDQLFTRSAAYWAHVYEGDAFGGLVYRRRQCVALSWVRQLQLDAEAAVLDVGCGAGKAAVEIAGHGYAVTAIDHAPAMVAATRRRALAAGLGDRVRAFRGDVHDLAFADGTFDLVLALGVLPWVAFPRRALAELARVVRPRGYVLVSVDNNLAVTAVIEPCENALVRPLKLLTAQTLVRAGRRKPGPVRNPAVSRRRLTVELANAGLELLHATTLGFGPVTFLRHPLLPEHLGRALDRRLQQAGDRGTPFVRSAGTQHLALARKP